jgi:hypothetical protein
LRAWALSRSCGSGKDEPLEGQDAAAHLVDLPAEELDAVEQRHQHDDRQGEQQREDQVDQVGQGLEGPLQQLPQVLEPVAGSSKNSS